MERGLVRIVGKKDVPGKPLVYGTTEEFLRLFGLNSLSQLPELKTFATKEVKEIQDDLPFNTPLPKADTILPLEEGETEIKETSVQNENETFDFTTEPKAENNTQEQITPEQEQKTEQQEQTKEEIKNEEEEPAQIKTEEIIENAMGQDEIK